MKQITPKNGVTIAVLLLLIFFSFAKTNEQIKAFVGGRMIAQASSVTVSASVSPSTVVLGNSTTLSWSSVNATSCSLDLGLSYSITNQPTTGTYVAFPTKKINYVVRCTGPTGSGRAIVPVTVTTAVSNTPPVANAGPDKAITLPTSSSAPTSASATDSDGIVASNVWSFISGPVTPTIINGNTLAPSFSDMNTAGTYVFRLTVTDDDLATHTDDMQVVVSPAAGNVALSFSATPISINSGQSSLLSWSSTNATSCTANGGWSGAKSTSGSQSVSPTVSTSYTLDCTGAGSPASQTINISVTPVSTQTATGAYDFEEVSGQMLLDSSPNLLHGTLGATNQVESSDPARNTGVIGGGLIFDGSDDFVSLPQSSTIDNLSNFTLEAWIYPTSYLDASNSLSELFNKGTTKKRFFMNSAVGTLGGIVLHATKPATTYTSSSVPLNQWSHVVMTYSSSNRLINIYINGIATVNAKQVAGSGTISADNTTSPFNWILGSDGGTQSFFKGGLDDVKIHNKTLSPAEVLTQYNNFILSDTTPPTVSVTSPTNGFTVKGIKLLTAEANDDFGIAGVRFQLNGVNYGAEDTTFPYSVTLDSTTLSDGAHTITAVARDKTNKITISSPVSVTVDNSQVNSRKNIVVIMTDDQRFDTMQYMPITTSLFADNTVKFENATASDPVCCPSRASFLTGLYAHNHNVMTVLLGPSFDDRSSIATWAEEQGYRTGLVGKYMVAYLEKLSNYVPRGWSHWNAFAKQGNLYSNYTLNENGVLKNYGTGDANYSTNVIAAKAVNFIETTPTSQPLMLYFTPSAPHAPANPASVDLGDFSSLLPWRPPSHNESDVSDKPTWVKKLPSLTSTAQSNIDSLRKKQIESLQAVDRAVQDIFDALARTGRLSDTIIVFTSDQGKSWGEHRWTDKECIYEECIRMPLWVKVPGGVNATNNDLVQNIDIVPTITDIAGISAPTPFNGKSLKDILNGQQVGPLRSEALYEFGGVKDSPNRIVIETAFSAIRDNRYVYAEYTNGDREFYDLLADPYQLVNQINNSSYSTLISNYQSKLFSLKSF